MKKFLLLLIVTITGLTQSAFGQLSTKYTYSTTNSGGYVATTGTALATGSGVGTDQVWTNQAIGFTFNFNCTNYTTLGISANGFVWFGSGSCSSTQYSPLSSTTGQTGSVDGVISAFTGNNLINSNTNTTNCYIRTQLTGTAPNRVFTIEWRRVAVSGATNIPFDAQIRLTETSNSVQIRLWNYPYFLGANTILGTVGMRGSATTDFMTRTTVGGTLCATLAGASNASTILTGNAGICVGNGYLCASSTIPLGFTYSFTGSCCTIPTGPPTGVNASVVSGTSLGLSFTRGNGAGVLVVCRATATPAVAPTASSVTYTASTNFTSPSSTTGTGNVVVYNGVGSPTVNFNVTNLTLGTPYTFDVYEYNTPTCYRTATSSASTTPAAGCNTPAAATVTYTGICGSGTSNLGLTGLAAETFTYQWETSPDGSSWSNASGTSTNATYTTPTISSTAYYRCQVTCASVPATTQTANSPQIWNPTPIITVTGNGTNPASICNASSVNLLATGATTYNWTSTPAGFTSSASNPTASPTTTTTYSCIGTANGCNSAATTVIVNVNPGTVSVTPSSATILSGASVSLTASATSVPSSTMSYSWSPSTGLDVTTGATVIASPASTQTYTVTATDLNGCSRSNTVTVTVGNGTNTMACGYTYSSSASYTQLATGTLIASGIGTSMDDVSYPNIPLGFTFNFNGIAYSTCVVNTNGFISFGTTVPNGNTYTPLSSVQLMDRVIAAVGTDLVGHYNCSTTPVIAYNTSGSVGSRVFTVQWLGMRPYIIPEYGICWDSYYDDQRIDFNISLYEADGRIEISYGDQFNYCFDAIFGNFQAGLRGATNADFLNRSLAGGNNLTSTNSTAGGANTSAISLTSTGTIIISYKYVNGNVRFTYTPTFPTPVITGPANTVLCSGTANLSFTPTGGISYNWFKDGVIIPGATGSTYTATAAGSYTVRANNASLCTKFSNPFILSPTQPAAFVPTVSVCTGQSATLAPTYPSSAIFNYYSALTGGSPLNVTPSATYNTGNLNATTDYYIATTDVNGCESTNRTLSTVKVNALPVLTANSPAAVCIGAPNVALSSNATSTSQYDVGVHENPEQYFNIMFNGSGTDSRTQFIITKAELNASGIINAGNISAMGFLITTKGSTGAYNNYSIKIANTASTTLTTTFAAPTFTTVYTGSVTTPAAPAWLDLTFTSNFAWDGTSNILVDVCYDNAATNGADDYILMYNGASAQTTYALLSSGTGCTQTTGFTTTYRPYVRLKGSVKYSWSPATNLTASNISNPSFTGTGAAGTYNYTVTATDLGNCGTNQNISVVVNDLVATPVFTAGPTTLCAGGTDTYTATAANSSSISYSIVGGVGASINSSTGIVSSVTGNFTVRATATGSCGANTTVDRTVTVNSCGPMTWTGALSTNWDTPGNWTPAGPPNAGTDITIPNVVNDPTIFAGTSAICKNITIDNGTPITFNAAETLTITGNWLSTNAGSPVVSGPGKVIFASASPQTITNANGATFSTLQINNSNGVTVATGLPKVNVTTALELKAGALTTNGNVRTVSTLSSTAYVNDFDPTFTPGTLNGNISIQRYITNAQSSFRYIGTPVRSAPTLLNLSGLTGMPAITGNPGQAIPQGSCGPTDNPNLASNSPYTGLMRWEEAGPFNTNCRQWGWWFQGATSDLTIGRGYGLKVSGGNTLTFTGTANTGSVTYGSPALINSNALGNGYHLVANPFPSALGISSSDANPNNNMPSGFDGYIIVFLSSGPYSGTYPPMSVSSGTAQVALGQAFWVHVSNPSVNGPTSPWTMTNGHRLAATNISYVEDNSIVEHHLKVDVAGNGYMDKVDINFIPAAETGFDFYDARKFASRATQPTVYIPDGDEMGGIYSLPSLEEATIVPLSVNAGSNGNFTFTFDDIASFPQTAMIYLEDLQLGTMTDLRANNSYAFSMNATDNPDRFMLHFQPGLQAEVADQDCDNAGSIELTQPAPTVWSAYEVRGNDNNVYAQGTNFTGSVTVSNLPAQEYVVTVTHPSGYTAQEYITVNGSSPVNATINASATNVMVDEPVNLTATANNATEYVWNFGDGNTQQGSSSVVHAYDAAGTYNVTVTASSNVCDDVANKTIVVGNTTGINGTEANNVKIYGQGERVVIEFNNWGGSKADIFMYNALGQRLESLTGISTLKGRQELYIADIVPGTYFIQVVSDGKIQGKKVFLGKQ